MPGYFDKQGLNFAYPDNWTLDDDEQGAADVAATVTSPKTAFWSVMLYRGARDVQLLADSVLEAMKSEYPQLEVEPLTSVASGSEDGPTYGYELSFAYLDLLSTAVIRAFQHQGNTYVVLSQAEDHELPGTEPVFAAMTASLTQAFSTIDEL